MAQQDPPLVIKEADDTTDRDGPPPLMQDYGDSLERDEPLVMNEKIKRPEVLRGYTYKIKTPLSDHALYITINNIILSPDSDPDCELEVPFEMFINSKNMEHYQWVVAMTLLVSAVFRKGGDVTFLVEEFKNIHDPQGGYFKKGGRFMPSLVAEIGEVIEKHMMGCGLITIDSNES